MLDAVSTMKPQGEESLVQGKVQDVQAALKGGDLRKASEQFEAYFLSYLLKTMRSTIPKGALTQNPMGEMYHAFYDEEIGKRAAESGGIGLAEMILSSLAEEPSSSMSDDVITSERLPPSRD